MKKHQKYLRLLRSVKTSIRVFPYSAYLLNTFPFFAVLIQAKLIDSFWSFFFVIPFVFVMAGGFAYNTFCDVEKDPEEKNPIKRREISYRGVLLIALFSLTISVLLFSMATSSLFAQILFLTYIFLWLAYSGLNIRLKESLLGPFVASFVLWTGPGFILLAEYHYFDLISITLLFGIFLVFASRETRHTVLDYMSDLNENCRTFAVRSGLKWANITQYSLLMMGIIFITISSYLYVEIIFSSSILVIAAIFCILSYFIVVPLSYFVFSQSYAPYYLTKAFLIIYACIMLDLSPMYILLVIWVSMSEKFP